MKTALLIHGAYGKPSENWFPWLTHELEKFDYTVIAPAFPTPDGQDLEKWLDVIAPHLTELDERSVLVGHSIGAVFLLSVLEKLDTSIGTSIFVSGFLHDLNNPDFDAINQSFYGKDFDWDRIKSNVGKCFVFHGGNDPYVPVDEACALAEKLDTDVTLVKNGGHLNESAGFTEFPELIETMIPFNKRKALLLPVNSDQKLFIQDRRGHKKPDWGYFGGEIEQGETPLEAVIRESKEELDIAIKPEELVYLGVSATHMQSNNIVRYIYLYRTDQKEFTVLEGAGGHWLAREETAAKLYHEDVLDDVLDRIY